jgi:hypothetical protein
LGKRGREEEKYQFKTVKRFKAEDLRFNDYSLKNFSLH